MRFTVCFIFKIFLSCYRFVLLCYWMLWSHSFQGARKESGCCFIVMNETNFSDRALQTPSSHLRLCKPLHQVSVTVRGTFGSEMANANPMKCRKRQQLPGFLAEWGCSPKWGRAPGVSDKCPPVERKGQGAARSPPPACTSGDWRSDSRARTPYSALPRGLSADSEQSMLCFRQS